MINKYDVYESQVQHWFHIFTIEDSQRPHNQNSRSKDNFSKHMQGGDLIKQY